MRKLMFVLALLVAGSTPGFLACAADGIKSIDLYAQEIELLREKIAIKRKAAVARYMDLSEEEANNFWPLYNAYRDKMKNENDGLIKVISDYDDDHQINKNATKLVDRYLSALQNQIKVKKSFVKKFKKVLTPIKVARFYQIDNRIDLLLNLQIAKGVPLAE